MVERDDRPAVAGFFTETPLLVGNRVSLDDAASHHVRVRRLAAGDPVRLLNGKGTVGWGALTEVGKRGAAVVLSRVMEMPRPTPLDVVVPVADRERMLLAAEKCVELQVTGWRPTYFARSRSVTSRGEGTKFEEKVLARMRGALEQSGSAWLPEIHRDAEWIDVIDAVPKDWNRFLLDGEGTALAPMTGNKSTAIAAGPEGGLERREKASAEQSGWRLVSLGGSTLRFETAIISSAAIVRALQISVRS